MSSRWLRLNVDWHLSSWLIVLSAESRLAWVQLLCHVKTHGFSGEAKEIAPQAAERLWFVNEPSIRQMLTAAEQAGALVIEDGIWKVVKWKQYQGDDTNAERQRRFKNKKVTVGNALVTEVTPTETETETETETYNPPTPQRGKFVKPSVDDVADYAKARGFARREAEAFHDFYTSKGWKVGRNPMKDWQAAWRNWERGKDVKRSQEVPDL